LLAPSPEALTFKVRKLEVYVLFSGEVTLSPVE
jgi:hypothetical protein